MTPRERGQAGTQTGGHLSLPEVQVCLKHSAHSRRLREAAPVRTKPMPWPTPRPLSQGLSKMAGIPGVPAPGTVRPLRSFSRTEGGPAAKTREMLTEVKWNGCVRENKKGLTYLSFLSVSFLVCSVLINQTVLTFFFSSVFYLIKMEWFRTARISFAQFKVSQEHWSLTWAKSWAWHKGAEYGEIQPTGHCQEQCEPHMGQWLKGEHTRKIGKVQKWLIEEHVWNYQRSIEGCPCGWRDWWPLPTHDMAS